MIFIFRSHETMHLNRSLICFAVLLVAGCRRPSDDEDVSGPVPPPAAEMAAMTENMSLDQKLASMEGEIDAALKENLKGGEALVRIFRAEAISDRLLEAPPPFTWLRDAYATETRLRQIQALADRCVAELRRQEPDNTARADITELQREVTYLRSELAAGGGTRPASLDSLMAGLAVDSTAASDAGPPD
jgi:hypothetical protein